MSVRYLAGYGLVLLSRLLRRVLTSMFWVASLPERFAVIVWSTREIERFATYGWWNDREQVRQYSALARRGCWAGTTEKDLVEEYFSPGGDLLNLACGAGREAFLLARRGLSVTACDWSPRMVAAAQRQAREAKLPVRFELADIYDLHYPEEAFDYLFLTNAGYSYLIPRRRRVRFLKLAHSYLRPGGVFIVSFARAKDGRSGQEEFFDSLFTGLRRYALFNQEYESGDCITVGSFIRFFQADPLKEEFDEARFVIKEWLWEEGYAVLGKN